MDRGYGFLELINCRSDNYRFFDQKFQSPAEIVPFCIKKGWINDEWQKCADWYWRNQDFNDHHLLWRAIHPRDYDKLMRLGSTTADLTEEYEHSWGVPDKRFVDANIHKSDFMWACPFISKAWEFGLGFEANPIIIVAYKQDFFKELEPNRHIWVKTDKNIDWKDTVEAIFVVHFPY